MRVPKNFKKNAMIWTAILTFVAVISVVIDKRLAFADGDIRELESKLQAALENPLYGSRFNEFSISVSECKINYSRRDSHSCENDSKLIDYNIFVDLSVYEINNNITEAEGVGSEFFGVLTLAPRPPYLELVQNISRVLDEIFALYRGQYGRGSISASLATQDFISKYPVNTLPAWKRVENCKGESWVHVEDIRLRVKYIGLSELRDLVEAINKICSIHN
ncbi:hypothetical protein [Tritonibacter mobilis]|uniref:hypothetical protein n=1 Tax=Tritonibacter mobilis TaxID=379347 RepID=UPI003A5BC8B2